MIELIQSIQYGVPEVSAAALFFLLFFGTFVSEDAACIAAGAAAANGRIGLGLAITACFAGIFVGDLLLYAAGRAIGPRVYENRVVRRLVSSGAQKRAVKWFDENGMAAVFLSRFITGLRLPTYLAAGAVKADIRKFAGYLFLAAAVWTPILVGAAAFSIDTLFRQNVIISMIVLIIAFQMAFKLSSYKNRRLFIGRLKRIATWEFWPIQVFYAPVAIYALMLGMRHRNLTAFAAANPAIPGGGFKGESKHEIYLGLEVSDAAAEHMLAHTLLKSDIEREARLAAARKFIEENGLSFPVVVKPNAGERGKDVRIVRSEEQLEAEISKLDTDLILQEFASGPEVSIFYYRFPTQPKGTIFSITEKRFPEVVGDGVSTLEQLIINDPRAVCMAEKYFERNEADLYRIPVKGESVRLVDIGTHSRGAIFVDGNRFKTKALENKIDEICRGFDGFYFGRFDIRASSFEDLMRGENFKIIELNGVTSESTNIYDPKYSLLDAYRILFRQWRLAYEIGVENLALGAKATGKAELIRLAFG